MASWLIHMDSSSGKSRVIRRAICSGLHAVTQARSPRWGLLRAFHCAAGPGHNLAVSTTNHTGELVLDVLAQPVVADELGGLRTPRAPLGIPLRDRCLV